MSISHTHHCFACDALLVERCWCLEHDKPIVCDKCKVPSVESECAHEFAPFERVGVTTRYRCVKCAVIGYVSVRGKEKGTVVPYRCARIVNGKVCGKPAARVSGVRLGYCHEHATNI